MQMKNMVQGNVFFLLLFHQLLEQFEWGHYVVVTNSRESQVHGLLLYVYENLNSYKSQLAYSMNLMRDDSYSQVSIMVHMLEKSHKPNLKFLHAINQTCFILYS